MMTHNGDMEPPKLSSEKIADYLSRAAASERRRVPMVLHKPGDYLNRVINFLMSDTYMQPHFHPGEKKIEYIQALEGKLAVLFFDDHGAVTKSFILERGGNDHINVPAFTWHTYVVLSDHAISYETMEGTYDPKTWKDMGVWAPLENTPESREYLKLLKMEAIKKK